MKEIIMNDQPNALKQALFRSQVGREPETVEADGCLPAILRVTGVNLTKWEEPDSQNYEISADGSFLWSVPEGEAVEINDEIRRIHRDYQTKRYLEDNGAI